MANVQLAVAGDDTTQVILSVPGVQGPAGSNLPPSGTTHQLLYKQSSTDYDTAWKLITNDNVDAAAAIAGTKISPDFGSQAVATTGQISGARVNVTDSTAPTNGLYLPSANSVALSTNGTGRLFIDASGQVGLNNAPVSPYGLTLGPVSGQTISLLGLRSSSDTGNSRIDFGDPTASDVARIQYEHAVDSMVFHVNAAERLRITSAGLVGIGTSSPGYKLDVNGEVAFSPNTAGKNTFYFTTNASNDASLFLKSDTTNKVNIQANGPSYFNGGSVGIGTTSPAAKLTVVEQTANTSMLNLVGLNNYIHEFQNRDAGNHLRFYVNTASPTWSWASNATEFARIDSSGRLLIGTSSASGGSNVHIQDAGGAQIALRRGEAATSVTSGEFIGGINFQDSGENNYASIVIRADANAGSGDYPGRIEFSTTADGASSPTERMRIGNAGRTSIFTTNTNSFEVATSAAAGTTYRVFDGAHSAAGVSQGTTSIQIFNNGNVQNTNNSYGAISDIKLKENIIDAGSQWDDLKTLQVRKYNFKQETGQQTHTQIGLIAQEVELVSPGLVSESPDRDAEGNDLGTVTKSVNYSVLYMKAVKALQEAMERIEVLEQRLNDAGIN